MNVLESIRKMRFTTPMVVVSAMFIGASGFIHVREWLDVYAKDRDRKPIVVAVPG